jgi:hypothetical protein
VLALFLQLIQMTQLLESESQHTTAGAITIDVFVTITGPTNRYIAKGLSIPPSSSVELVTGGAKFVMQSTDILKVESDTATSADVYVSVVDSISA